MSETAVYLESIREVYPDFSIEKVRAKDQGGQFNDILVINEEFIFRFPRYSEGIARLITEVRLLNYIKGHLSLAIPDPIFTNLKPQAANKVFMGYRMIPGEPLWREKFATIQDDITLQRLADQLANFLKELHSIPVESLIEDLPVQDGPEEWARMYAEVQKYLYQFMSPGAQSRVSQHFETYLDNPRLHRYTVCLRHGDFGTGNILYETKTRTIVGIIDFGELGLGDAAIDIASISCFGEEFHQRL